MAFRRSTQPLQWLCGLLVLATAVSALKFELMAHTGGESTKKERCIRNFVGQETLVVVTATVDGYKGDGMSVNMHVSLASVSDVCRQADGSRSATPLATSMAARVTL